MWLNPTTWSDEVWGALLGALVAFALSFLTIRYSSARVRAQRTRDEREAFCVELLLILDGLAQSAHPSWPDDSWSQTVSPPAVLVLRDPRMTRRVVSWYNARMSELYRLKLLQSPSYPREAIERSGIDTRVTHVMFYGRGTFMDKDQLVSCVERTIRGWNQGRIVQTYLRTFNYEWRKFRLWFLISVLAVLLAPAIIVATRVDERRARARAKNSPAKKTSGRSYEGDLGASPDRFVDD